MPSHAAALRAALAVGTHVRALPGVALVDRADHCARDVPRLGVARPYPSLDRTLLPRCAGLSETLVHGLVDQQIHCAFDEDCQVAIRHLMTQQILELLQFVMQRLSGRELQLVAPRAERFGRGPGSRRFQRESRSVRVAEPVAGRIVRVERWRGRGNLRGVRSVRIARLGWRNLRWLRSDSS